VNGENVPLVPYSVVTIMPIAPTLRAGVIQVIVVLFTTLIVVAAKPSNVIDVTPIKDVPVIVTLVPPAVLPLNGETPVTFGGVIIPTATPNPEVEKMEVPRPIQLTPSVLVATVFVPCPTAIQTPLLKATPIP
jgi:hypothetical protein